MKKKVLLYAHGSSYNHGCEAIVRSTVDMLQLNYKNAVLSSTDRKSDARFGLDKIVNIKSFKQKSILKRNSLKGYLYRVLSKLEKIDYDTYESMDKQRDLLRLKSKVAISIGGDNYCYPGIRVELKEHNKLLNLKGVKTVLWGCSIEEHVAKYCVQDLSKYSLITARESLTYSFLKKYNIDTNVVLVADPAFTLKTEKVHIPWGDEKVIGINVSPFMLKYNEKAEEAFNAVVDLVNYINNELKLKVVFVSHVGDEQMVDSNDIYWIDKIYQKTSKENIVLGMDYNCMQLKYLISKLDFFIGARTHATIAACSTCVPTLVLGYSIKSQGIAKDIFGEIDKYVIKVNEIDSGKKLINAFSALYKDKDSIRKYLEDFMPEYIQRAYIGVKEVEKLLQEK